MINKIILIGNVGKDPDFKVLDSGTSVANFSLATSESYKDKNGEWQTLTEWHDVICWRSLADRAQTQIKKGVSIYVEGKLTHRTWEDQDGNKRRNSEVVASYFRVLTKRDEQQQTESEHQPVTEHSANGGQENDDLPF